MAAMGTGLRSACRVYLPPIRVTCSTLWSGQITASSVSKRIRGEAVTFQHLEPGRPAAPMPPPTHMVTTTYRTPRRLAFDERVPDQSCARHAVRMARSKSRRHRRSAARRGCRAGRGSRSPARRRPRSVPTVRCRPRRARSAAAAAARRTRDQCPSHPVVVPTTAMPTYRPSGVSPRALSPRAPP